MDTVVDTNAMLRRLAAPDVEETDSVALEPFGSVPEPY